MAEAKLLPETIMDTLIGPVRARCWSPWRINEECNADIPNRIPLLSP